MPRASAKPRSRADFKHALPIQVSLSPFRLSTAFRHIDPVKIAAKASVEVEVGTFEGKGCGRTVSAVVSKGRVVQLKVTPCAETRAMRSDPALKALLAVARRQLGGRGTPPKFKPMAFSAFQKQAGPITTTTITCTQICIFDYCFVCCSTPFGTYLCGRTITVNA